MPAFFFLQLLLIFVHNTLIMKQTTQHFLLLLVMALLLFSCQDTEARDINRAVNVFFLGLFQVFNILLFGISSFVLCLLGMTNNKVILKRIGLILMVVFGIFMLLGLTAVIEQNPKHGTIYVLFLFEFAIIGTNIIFLVLKPKGSSSSSLTNTLHDSSSGSGRENDLIDF